jgi:hypothetical protein
MAQRPKRRDLRRALRAVGTNGKAGTEFWLPFLNAYRTMCLAPEPDFRRVLEQIRNVWVVA